LAFPFTIDEQTPVKARVPTLPAGRGLKPIDNGAVRKRILGGTPPDARWWDLTERVAEVAVTSEDPDHLVESMLAGGQEWRAAVTGEQTIRLTFGDPQQVSHILLRFVEKDIERTQEFSLGWAGEDEGSFRNLVRQQWTFSPRGATEEVENYHFDLKGVRAIELTIRPGRADAIASLAEFKFA
jgi:hypothetical protein